MGDNSFLDHIDWNESTTIIGPNYCRKQQISIETLNRKEKGKLIHLLAKEGAFKERNAANYVGRVPHISRSTVYNYLKKKI